MKKTLIFIFCISTFLFSQTSIANEGIPMQSGGSYQLEKLSSPIGPYIPSEIPLAVTSTYAGDMDFDRNFTEHSSYNIPPDPCGAAGTDRLVAVTNCMIEMRLKDGTLVAIDALRDFFSTAIPAPATRTFDPKVVWDHYENRFVVVTLEAEHTGTNPDANNTSYIYLAVSKTATPATLTSADWWYYAIDAKETRSGDDHWADYPGFEVCEEAIYITNSMFAHTGGTTDYTSRLWIVNKHGVANDWYTTGLAPTVTTWEHFTQAGLGGFESTTMPASVYGATGASPAGTGTYLVSYSGLSYGEIGGNEGVWVIRISNPITAPTFTDISGGSTVILGDIEDIGGSLGWPDLPDAPQNGTANTIEVNDRRVLDAVWQDDPNHSPMLWFTTTINPNAAFDATNAGETTAMWARINTTTATLDDKGTIGGEDIAAGTYTFFPSLAVNPQGNAYFGFSASAATIFPGAYAAGQHHSDAAGTVRGSETIAAGTDYYYRMFASNGGTRNRWGDYTGTALDPADNTKFWVFNQFAMTRGTIFVADPTEDGRWDTIWGTGDFPLPVILGSYTAEVTIAGVKLNWTTESEIENLGFIIEHRLEGGEWAELVSYKTDVTLGGQGTTTSFTDYEYLDQLVEVGNTYEYRLADVDYNGIVNYNAVRTVTIDKVQLRNDGVPLILMNPYPNPFNPTTLIQYSISEKKNVLVEIYDITGQLVNTIVNKEQLAGWHNVQWNGTNGYGKIVPAGMYIGKITAGNDIKTTKLMLLK